MGGRGQVERGGGQGLPSWKAGSGPATAAHSLAEQLWASHLLPTSLIRKLEIANLTL